MRKVDITCGRVRSAAIARDGLFFACVGSPACFAHAWDHSLQRQLTKLVPTDAELAIHTALAAGDLATHLGTGAELWLALHLVEGSLAGHVCFRC